MREDCEYCSPKNSNNFYDNLNDILCDIEFIKKGKSEKISNVASVFDMEASSFYNHNNEKQCCMYAWVFGLNGRCIKGRYWHEFTWVINSLVNAYNLSPKNRLIIYVHNLSYEFQWIKGLFKWEKVFSLDNRKPCYAITKNGIEFRCSYILSGYSLEILGENLTKYKVSKKVGDLDYSLLRHSQTPLTEKEWGYILNDGLVVMAYIQEEIERLGSIKDIPLTKTGYVRNLCKEKCLKGENRWSYVRGIKTLTLEPETYLQAKQTYMGGFTHANINYVGKTLKNVYSYDFCSSYPAVMISEKFPMSKPIFTFIKDEKDFMRYLKTFCCMFECKFYNIRSKVSFDNYISLSKCQTIENYVSNNGRIIEADSLKISLTEQDFFIIAEMYDWDCMEVSNFYYFFTDYLPKELITTILELYKDKTELKGIEEKIVEYLVSKGMINSVYGMCVTEPCRDEIIFDGEWKTKHANIEEQLDTYNRNNNRILYYYWGIWVTAYSRRNLFSGILEFKDDYIYSDTDSLKIFNKNKHIEYIKEYNNKITDKVNACLTYYGIDISMANPKTIKGIHKPIGIWEYEGKYDKFKTLGAKRYIYEQNGDLNITIAGVNKKSGKEYLLYTYGDKVFENFEDNLHFPAHYDKDGIDSNGSGKLCHTYIDDEMEGLLIDYLGNKYHYKEKSGVFMENTDYTLGLENTFKKLLLGIKESHII